MDINEMEQNENYSDDMPLEPSVRLNSYTRGVYGEPKICPRVGNQYQVEIPSLISVSEYNSCRKNPFDEENKGGSCDFVMGLPIPIICVNPENKPNKDKKINFMSDLKLASKKNRRNEHNVESSEVRSRIENVETDELEEKLDEIKSVLVPGSSDDSWTDIEKASFLLGLYIFRKNFVKVKKFVETKNMGEILLCYHAKFYKTVEYRRWSGCRKGDTRKCALGERFFSGLRQQELLSRLVRGISDEIQYALMQVSKSFSDKEMLLEDYVISLKNLVGINNLVNAVGIGRGKEDLTYNYVRPEVPIGKACNSLSRSEIIEFLTGDFRLSKARSYDLFWEAVWPILVEKGWNATELSSYKNSASSKQFQVFFVPGVQKSSSRRRLVKGEEYFDSIADVLNLIAFNPGILGLDEKKDDGTEKTHVKDGNDDLTADKLRHCYLQPQTPSRCAYVLSQSGEVSRKLTFISQSGEDTPEVSTDESDFAYGMQVVKDNKIAEKLTKSRSENMSFAKRKDLKAQTSLNHGKNSKSDNAHIAIAFNPGILGLDEKKDDGTEKTHVKDGNDDLTADKLRHYYLQPQTPSRCTYVLSQSGEVSRKLTFISQSVEDTPEVSTDESDSAYTMQVVKDNEVAEKLTRSRFEDMSFSKRKDLEAQTSLNHSKNSKSDNAHIAPVGKRRRGLTSTRPSSDTPEISENNVHSSQVKLSVATSSSGASSMESFEEHAQVNEPIDRSLFDLNLPAELFDFDCDNFLRDLAEPQNSPDELAEPMAGAEEGQVNLNPRRQSSRNRPPTARALEAIAHGFLSVNSRRGRANEAGTSDAADGTNSNISVNGEI